MGETGQGEKGEKVRIAKTPRVDTDAKKRKEEVNGKNRASRRPHANSKGVQTTRA